MKTLASIIVLITILLSCQETKKATYSVKHELIQDNDCKSDKRYGHLVLCFTYRYSLDTLEIYVNDTLFKTTYLKTDDVVGVSQVLEIDKIKNIKSARFKINHNNNVNIPFDSVNQMFLISKINDTITLESVCYLPSFM